MWQLICIIIIIITIYLSLNSNVLMFIRISEHSNKLIKKLIKPLCRNISGVYEPKFPDNLPYNFNFTEDTSDVSPFTKKGTKVKMLNYLDKVEIIFQGTCSSPVRSKNRNKKHKGSKPAVQTND